MKLSLEFYIFLGHKSFCSFLQIGAVCYSVRYLLLL
jgi:hypothetical protein